MPPDPIPPPASNPRKTPPPEGTSAAARPRPAVRWLAAAAVLALTFVLSEIALRLTWTPRTVVDVPAFGPHPDYHMAPLAGVRGRREKPEYSTTFVHSDQRLRMSREVTRERRTGCQARILFLGDSFTYGLGSSDAETFVERLASRWPAVECVNAGCNGYGQREELAVLDRLGAAIQPDLTVVMFFWNDLEDNLRPDAPRYELGPDGQVRRTQPSTPPADPLRRWPPARSQPSSRSSVLYTRELLRESTDRLRYMYLGTRPRAIRTPEQKASAWNETQTQLRLLKRRAQEIGTRLVIIPIPDHNQINPAARIRNIDPLHFEIQERLASICTAEGLDYADPRPDFEKAFRERPANSPPLYYYVDRHLTPSGNAVLARFLEAQLARFLPANLPLPPSPPATP